MVAWTEYREMARARGALALELFVVHSTPTGSPQKVKDTLAAHLEYQRQLEQQGVLAMAGPLSDPTGEMMTGAGMIIYRAASLTEAHTLAQNDPMHASGARNFTLHKWLINEGNLSINVGLSTGKAVLS